MKIVRIEPFVVNQELNETFHFSQWEYSSRTICLVKVTTDDGLYGWGEGYGPAAVIKTGVEFISQFIIGMDVMDTEKIWDMMYFRTLDYSRKGIFTSAISAIDVALWDLKGKYLNQPVSVLLGGRKNTHVKPYATGLYFRERKNLAEDLAEEALMYKDQGFKGIKMKVGLGVKRDAALVKKIRETIGDDISLMIDSNHAYSFEEAARLASLIEDCDITWFEEPVSPEYYGKYNELREKTSIPIAAGECEYLRYGFLQLCLNKSVDIAQPDICATGGISEVKKIIAINNAFGVTTAPHSWGTGIAIHAAMHVISNMTVLQRRLYGEEPWIEYDRTENELRDKLTLHQIKVENGLIKVPELPGLGIEVDMDLLRKYSI